MQFGQLGAAQQMRVVDQQDRSRRITVPTRDPVPYRDAGPVGLFIGEVDVTSQVVSYQRRRIGSGEVLDTRPLDLPARQLRHSVRQARKHAKERTAELDHHGPPESISETA